MLLRMLLRQLLGVARLVIIREVLLTFMNASEVDVP